MLKKATAFQDFLVTYNYASRELVCLFTVVVEVYDKRDSEGASGKDGYYKGYCGS